MDKRRLGNPIAKSKMIVLLDLFDWGYVVLLMKWESIMGIAPNYGFLNINGECFCCKSGINCIFAGTRL